MSYPSVQLADLRLTTDQLVQSVLARFPDGAPFDAAALIAESPSLRDKPSAMVDLAYEEFVRRQDQGEQVDVERFVARFPVISSALARVFDFCEAVQLAPDLFFKDEQLTWPTVGTSVGPFELTQQLGRGSFSRVYRARDTSLGRRQVVLKLTNHAHHEAEALGQLQHRNIVTPLGLYRDLTPGLIAIAMPDVGRATLIDLADAHPTNPVEWGAFDYPAFLKRFDDSPTQSRNAGREDSPLSFAQRVAWIGAKLADALHHAHTQGFLHCDIKPSNILLCNDGQPMLLDFNLSRRSDSEDRVTGGTLAYMAPEQVRALGTSADVTSAADVFSLGATLIEVLSGTSPFGRSTASVPAPGVYQHPLNQGAASYQLPATVRIHVGDRLTALLERCVLRDPAARPKATELARELRECLPKPPVITGSKRGRRFRMAVMAGCLATVLLGTAGYQFTIPSPEQSYARGMTALTEHQAETASAHFTRILKSDPTRTDVKALRACALIEEGKFDDARKDLLDLREKFSTPQLVELIAYADTLWAHDYKVAEIEYIRLLRQGVETATVLNNLGYCKYWLRQFPQADQLYRRAQAVADPVTAVTILQNRAYLERARVMKDKGAVNEELIDELEHHGGVQQSLRGKVLTTQLCLLASDLQPTIRQRGLASLEQLLQDPQLTSWDRDAMMKLAASQKNPSLANPFNVKANTMGFVDRREHVLNPGTTDPEFLNQLVSGLKTSNL